MLGQATMRSSRLQGRTLLWRSSLVAMVSATVISAMGCGQSGPEFAPAAGVVTLDGQPLAEAGVMFTPIQGGPVASATTDADGRFELRTLSHDGAIVGEHQISITKGRTEEKWIPNATVPLIRFVSELPDKYARRESSGLSAKVSSDDDLNDFALQLTSK
jgi:predicted small lipoprotein YifL